MTDPKGYKRNPERKTYSEHLADAGEEFPDVLQSGKRASLIALEELALARYRRGTLGPFAGDGAIAAARIDVECAEEALKKYELGFPRSAATVAARAAEKFETVEEYSSAIEAEAKKIRAQFLQAIPGATYDHDRSELGEAALALALYKRHKRPADLKRASLIREKVKLRILARQNRAAAAALVAKEISP